jgi:hypothetical protein
MGLAMNKTMMIALCVGALAPQVAEADAASDRVMLEPHAVGCPTGSTGFKRVKQHPDGSQSAETAEFVVPAGKYLEITSIDYTTPYSTRTITSYVQHVSLNIRQRLGAAATNVFHFSYNNKTQFVQDADYTFDGTTEFMSPGAATRVASFPAGPLMSPQGRLCVTAPDSFWLFQGRVRVRGRLIAQDGIVVQPGGGVLANQ